MRRRQVMGLLGVAAATLPFSARAQQAKPVIGFLGSQSAGQWTERLRTFKEGLRTTGYIEGENVSIEYRWAESQSDRLPGLVADLVRRHVAVIVVLGNTPSALAAKSASGTIPVVFRVAVDPVEAGLVASLSRPSGNVTGISTLGAEAGQKQLEILHGLAPKAGVVGLLINPTNTVLSKIQTRDLKQAAQSLGLSLPVLTASSDPELDAAFAKLTELQAKALIIGADAFLNSRSEALAALAIRYQVPAIAPYREFPFAGGLISYGGNIAEASRLAGIYTGRILKGEKPGDLPVQEVTKVEMVLNLKTAKIFGIEVPAAILATADEVIE
jgi:putative tryptophan/tyrosine transport system substrate-binding protein